MTRKRISGILKLGEMLLSFLTDFGLVNAAVLCANLESISGLEPSSDTTQPWYLKLVTVSSFFPFTLISLLMLLQLFVINEVFSALISMWLWRLRRDSQLTFPVLPFLLSHRCLSKVEISDCSASDADNAFVIF